MTRLGGVFVLSSSSARTGINATLCSVPRGCQVSEVQTSVGASAHLCRLDVCHDAQVNGSVRYNGMESKDFVIRRTAGLVEQGGRYPHPSI